MDRIEFDATPEENGRLIRIPDEYVQALAKKGSVHVTVSSDNEQSVKRPERATVRRMREHPIYAPGVKPLTREEIYDRSK
jgi:hypothetical protein